MLFDIKVLIKTKDIFKYDRFFFIDHYNWVIGHAGAAPIKK